MMPANIKYLLCTGEIVGEDKVERFTHAHVIGVVDYRYDQELGRKVIDLAIFREAIKVDAIPNRRPPVAAYVPALRKAPCSLCERAAKWSPTNASFQKLIGNHNGGE